MGKQLATVGAKRGPNTRSTRPSKFPQMDSSSTEQVNYNKCCVCFVLYEEDQYGKDWVACACGRSLHEDCADDCIIDSDGNERLCFLCLNHLQALSFLQSLTSKLVICLISSYYARL